MSARVRGFTLIEMLAAVAVLAIAMAAILSGMARYANDAGYLRQKALATWIAHNRLAEIDLAPVWPDVGKSDGEAEMAGVKWKWRAEVQATPDPHLRRVEVKVLAPGRDTHAASLTAFIADTGRQ